MIKSWLLPRGRADVSSDDHGADFSLAIRWNSSQLYHGKEALYETIIIHLHPNLPARSIIYALWLYDVWDCQGIATWLSPSQRSVCHHKTCRQPLPRKIQNKNSKFDKNIDKRGKVPIGKAAERNEDHPPNQTLIIFFFVIVVGSSLVQILNLFFFRSKKSES